MLDFSPGFAKPVEFMEHFEGREGIYIEQGVLLVRVYNVGIDALNSMLTAQVEEVPTAGLGFVMALNGNPAQRLPFRWSIGAHLSNENSFSMLHWRKEPPFAWSLYFEPMVVSAVVNFAKSLPQELKPRTRYRQLLRFVHRPRRLPENATPDGILRGGPDSATPESQGNKKVK